MLKCGFYRAAAQKNIQQSAGGDILISPTSCAGASRGFLNSAKETGSENFANMEGRS